ncbi:bestrophin-2-like [Mytilus californianus]|uniref:bestrophin-2-like n=1 Tax=Mytilus californianus TaxID=6549 RepID=UPI0022477B3A|nr:bestrophin-2-like [Mytilus californianus]
MTIIYQYKVANTGLGTFTKLLARWRGSVYKLLYKEMLIYSALYTLIALIYRLVLNEDQRTLFEKVVLSCNQYTSYIPLSFVLGFYVSMVVSRWWRQFQNFPWPDRTVFMLCCYLPGQTDRKRILRRTVARYLMFGIILIARSISVAVMKRFPTLDHIVEAGFITKEEAMMYENIDCRYNKFWVPFMWINSVLVTARKEALIQTEWGLRMIVEPLADIRDTCSKCFVYDWITIPLVYTQVVTLAVYTFFATTLVSQQFLDPSKNYKGYGMDFYIPIFTLLQFFFYMGWLKVAEQLINPFGEDDDDFDINWLIDRHAAVVMALVDQMCDQCPPLIKDLHFENMFTEVPYTEASIGSKRPMFLGSTYNLASPTIREQRIVLGDVMDQDSNRHMSFGSNAAGSLLSVVTGRSSYSRPQFFSTNSHDHLYNMPLEKQYMDYQPKPNGYNPETMSNMDEELDFKKPSNLRPPRMSKRQSWSSDSSLTKRTLARVAITGRDRSNTDSRKSRKRKVSFPLHLIKFFSRTDSRKSSNDSNSTVKSIGKMSAKTRSFEEGLEKDFDYAQEYVPLKRANVDSEDDENSNERVVKSKARRRKTSCPPNLFEHASDIKRKLSSPNTNEKTSRFTVEKISDGSDMDARSMQRRNAQKIEKVISDHAVSRAPLLSAIEEGGTITSISQLEDTVIRPSPTIQEEEEIFEFGDGQKMVLIPVIQVNGQVADNIQ